MPRLTIKDLSASLEAKQREIDRLVEANSRLQTALLEQAEIIRSYKAPPAELGRALESHCPICFEPLSDFDPTLHCGHELCRRCCLVHFKENSACPLCRREATPKELWRFRNPAIAGYWSLLKGDAWPGFGDFIVVTTSLRVLVGRYLGVSNEKKSISITYHLAEWEIALDSVEEIFTMQCLLNCLPAREDGLRRIVANA
jgi:hypothetical protein